MVSPHLISQARQGDTIAQEEILALLRDRVGRTASYYSRHTGMECEDLEQEMWLGVLAGLKQVDVTIGNPLCYLFMRGKWRMFEAVRRADRQRMLPLETDQVAVTHAFEEEIWSDVEAARVRARLKGRGKAVFDGLLKGFGQDEMARELGCSAANVSYHVQRIRAQYRLISSRGL